MRPGRRSSPLLALALSIAGCASPPPAVVVPCEGLQRDRYVLPPEPPPPRPMSDDERRALEAEWPAPTTRDIPEYPTIISTWDVATYASPDCGPRDCGPRDCGLRERGRGWRDGSRSRTAGAPSAVLVRVVPTCGSPPAVILEMR